MGSWCGGWFYLIWPVPVAGLGRPVNREEDEALNIGQSEWQSFETFDLFKFTLSGFAVAVAHIERSVAADQADRLARSV